MKKIISLNAIFMIAALSFIQFTGKAQSFSLAPSVGLNLDQDGIIREYDPVVGLTAFFDPGPQETSMFSLGLDMRGGQWFRYPLTVRTKDNKSDSTAWITTNAPSIMLWGTLNIPRGGGEDGDSEPNKFAGPVVGMGYGMAFPSNSRTPGNIFKIFLQGNYCIKDGGKVRIAAFVRPSFNVLYADGIHENWQMEGGFTFIIANSASE